MAANTALKVLWHLSPRVVVIPAPTTTISIQDLTDSIKDFEDEPANLSQPALVRTSGKEDLGGGVLVGITAQFQNAQLAFEQRADTVSSGTVTTANANGTILIDSAATFITDGVTQGATVDNYTDLSLSTVISVDSETQLTIFKLEDGTDNDFDFGDVYRVRNKVQCEVNGGNLVAIDEDGASISAFFPTAQTHVIRTSSSSATLQEQEDIQQSAFNTQYGPLVQVDPLNVTGLAETGTVFPAGTGRRPCLNVADALVIGATRGLPGFLFRSSVTLNDSALDLSNKSFYGESPATTNITIDPLANVDDCRYYQATITGTLDGDSVISECEIGTLSFLKGFIIDSVFNSGAVITLGGSDEAHFFNCKSGVPGGGPSDTPIIDMGGTGQAMLMRDYTGGISLRNKTGADKVSIDLLSGQVVIDDTVTGDITLRGKGKWTNRETYAGGGNISYNELDDARWSHALWTRFGLNDGESVTITENSIISSQGTVNITVTGDGVTSDTLTS